MSALIETPTPASIPRCVLNPLLYQVSYMHVSYANVVWPSLPVSEPNFACVIYKCRIGSTWF